MAILLTLRAATGLAPIFRRGSRDGVAAQWPQSCERHGASRRLKNRDLLAMPAASAVPLTCFTQLWCHWLSAPRFEGRATLRIRKQKHFMIAVRFRAPIGKNGAFLFRKLAVRSTQAVCGFSADDR